MELLFTDSVMRSANSDRTKAFAYAKDLAHAKSFFFRIILG